MCLIKALKKTREFKKVYKNKKYYVSPFTVLYIIPNNREENRIGISISKKVGNSVVRHRLKRLYREVYRLRENELEKGFDLVIVARKKAVELDYKKTWKDLNILFKKSKILICNKEE